MKKILVFQHLDIEHPGVFCDFFKEDGIAWDVVELDQGEQIPDLNNYDALWVMGGPMDVWQEDDHPWLVQEKIAIKKAITELNLPYLGICLGHQLLVSALGGEVALGESEVGIMPVELTEAGKQCELFKALPSELETLQWHGAEVKTLPQGFTTLASSDKCAHQSLAYGNYAYSTQFHVEITKDTVPEWNTIPEYNQALKNVLGENGAEEFEQEVNQKIEAFNQNARIFYENWKSLVS